MSDPLFYIFLILVMLYFASLFYEKYRITFMRKKFKHIIHVNGTRGKSTVCRLIDAILRQENYRVFTKTTGTVPSYIDCDGIEHTIKRKNGANIREQIRMMHMAFQQAAEILVIECMAVDPRLQYVSQHQMLKADIVIITNVRLDHTLEMGSSLEAVALALAATVPQDGLLIVGQSVQNEVFARKCEALNSKWIRAKGYLGSQDIPTMKENVDIALTLAQALGLNLDKAHTSLHNYRADPGAMKIIQYQNTTFINGFSINDPASTKLTLDTLVQRYPLSEITFLLNNRSDRPIRTKQLVDFLSQLPIHKLIMVGAHQRYVYRRLRTKKSLHIVFFKDETQLLEEKVIFAFGNIAHDGMRILRYFEDNGEKIYG